MDAEAISGRPIVPRRVYVIGALLAVGAVVAFRFDLAMLEFMRQGRIRGDLRRLILYSEVFAHGLGVAAILATVVVLDPRRVGSIPRLLACAFGPGIAVNLIKLMVGRLRPRKLEFASVWDSFQGWMPALREGNLRTALDSSIQSFPSGHAATAVGLAVVLSLYYPRGRWLFATFAVLACVQRLQENAHFLSDTLAGAAVGCLIAGLCCDPARWGKWFDRRWEGK
jgi:membrane-associated phospholipid phosphatase